MRRALEALGVLAGLIAIAGAAAGAGLGGVAMGLGISVAALAAWRFSLIDGETAAWVLAPRLWLQRLRRSPAAFAGAAGMAVAALLGRPRAVLVRVRRAVGGDLASAAFASAAAQDPRLLATATDAEGLWLQALSDTAVDMPSLRALEANAARVHP